MSVTSSANALALSAVIASTMDSISVISVKNISGEFFRKIPTDIEVITSQKKQFTFFLTENEGNGSIIGLSLYGNGATATLGTGTEIVSQVVSIEKDDTNSLTVVWTVEVTQT